MWQQILKKFFFNSETNYKKCFQYCPNPKHHLLAEYDVKLIKVFTMTFFYQSNENT